MSTPIRLPVARQYPKPFNKADAFGQCSIQLDISLDLRRTRRQGPEYIRSSGVGSLQLGKCYRSAYVVMPDTAGGDHASIGLREKYKLLPEIEAMKG